ncbi:MAG: class II glutamine amidotransferase [Polyangiaceae bacterium]
MHRSTECAAESTGFSQVAERETAELVIAHVRQKTVGATMLKNTHPFRRGSFVLAHNGTIDGVGWLTSHTSTERRNEIEGETDSEKLFAFLMTRLDEHGTAEKSGRRGGSMVALSQADRDGNFLFSDGSTLFAFGKAGAVSS